jgi:hypothetical protein
VKYKKTAMLVLAGLPVFAYGQTSQPKPVQQAAATAPATQPGVAANSRRFVSNENFYHPAPKPQPGSATPMNAMLPTTATATSTATLPGTMPVLPKSLQPTAMAADAGVVHIAQPVQTQPTALNPATVEHSPAVAVDYAYGKLTVVADNAPLGSVLKLIAAKTGATVDLAPELQNEPVVARLGPDSVRDVLSRLLDSPRVDYIVFGTGDEPGSLQRILVHKRNSFGQMAASRPQPQPVQQASEMLDADGNPISSGDPAEAQMTQEQRNAKWQKAREEMLQAEIKRQAEEREQDKIQPAEQPQPSAPAQDNPPES